MIHPILNFYTLFNKLRKANLTKLNNCNKLTINSFFLLRTSVRFICHITGAIFELAHTTKVPAFFDS